MKPHPDLEHGEESLLGGSRLGSILNGVLNLSSDVLSGFLDLLDSRLNFLLAISEHLLEVFKSGGGVSLGLHSFSLVSVSSSIEIVISIHEVFIIFSIKFIVFGIEFIININPVFIIDEIQEVFIIGSNNLGGSVGGRLDGLNRSGGISLMGRSDAGSRLNSRSVDRSGSNGTVNVNSMREGSVSREGTEDRERSSAVSVNSVREGSVSRESLEDRAGTVSGVLSSKEFIIFSIKFIVFSIELIIFGIEFIISINPVFVVVIFDKVFIIGSNNLGGSVGGRLDGKSSGLKRSSMLGGVSVGNRSSSENRLGDVSAVGRSGSDSSVNVNSVREVSVSRKGAEDRVRSGTVEVNSVREGSVSRESLEDRAGTVSGVLSSKEFIIFSKQFIVFSIEFIIFSIKFIVEFNKVFVVIVEESGLNLGLSGFSVGGVHRSSSGNLSSGVLMALVSFSH